MKSLKVQVWLRNYLWGNGDVTATLEKFKSSFGINSKQHSIHPNLFGFKYNQLECDFNNEIVCECRGLILDAADNWQVVAMPFYKFFNSVEIKAAKLDWATTRVQEKLDGSCIQIYYYKGWNISTMGCPDGLNIVGDTGITFRDLALSCIEKQKLDLTEWSRYYTYIFELTSPLNRVVVDHKEAKLTLIGIRNNETLKEVPLNDIAETIWMFGPGQPPIVQEHPLSSLDDCLKASEKLNPLEHEGYVAVDANFNRVKIKSPAYVAIHHIKDSCSLAKMAIVIKNGEYEEFLIALQSYPLVLEQFNKLVERYKDVIKICTETYDKIKDISNQKEFALLACQAEYSTVLFSMRKSGKSAQQMLHDTLENTFLRIMGVK
jgi:hypothetical protein